jgi:Fe-S-cluster containining protein
MENKIVPDSRVCRNCTVGSCCYEGAELSPDELKRIIRYDPAVPKPWFRLVAPHEGPEEEYPFSTIMREGTCVFQDTDNRCLIYSVRPRSCRDFPYEKGKTAPYFQRLCVQWYQKWPNNIIKRTCRQRVKRFR